MKKRPTVALEFSSKFLTLISMSKVEVRSRKMLCGDKGVGFMIRNRGAGSIVRKTLPWLSLNNFLLFMLQFITSSIYKLNLDRNADDIPSSLHWPIFLCPFLYGVESDTLSPQVKKRHSVVRAALCIQICTHSCMHVQCKQHMQASPINENFFSLGMWKN